MRYVYRIHHLAHLLDFGRELSIGMLTRFRRRQDDARISVAPSACQIAGWREGDGIRPEQRGGSTPAVGHQNRGQLFDGGSLGREDLGRHAGTFAHDVGAAEGAIPGRRERGGMRPRGYGT